MVFTEGYAYKWTGGRGSRNFTKRNFAYNTQTEYTSESDSSVTNSTLPQTHSRLSKPHSSRIRKEKRAMKSRNRAFPDRQ